MYLTNSLLWVLGTDSLITYIENPRASVLACRANALSSISISYVTLFPLSSSTVYLGILILTIALSPVFLEATFSVTIFTYPFSSICSTFLNLSNATIFLLIPTNFTLWTNYSNLVGLILTSCGSFLQHISRIALIMSE